MIELTQDPFVVIIYSGLEFMIYYDINSDEQWVISGICNLCGQCLEGSINPDIRPYNERLDCPVRPEISKLDKCSLKGVYI